MQDRGVDVIYYIPIEKGFKNGSILEFSKPWNKWGIIRASKMEEMQPYKDCINLNHLFFISGYTLHFWDVSAWLLWIYAVIHILSQRADVIHITWQLGRYENFLLRLPFKGKKVMTVHDPLQHSGTKDYEKLEDDRKRCFRWADELILLNKDQISDFCKYYNIDNSIINISHLGAYNSILKISPSKTQIKKPYIIFFGQISPNKGLEYLLEAMKEINKKCPEVTLLIAGKGNIYFDSKQYENLNCIEWQNRYIGVRELVSYVRNSMFAVCPYKDATQSGVAQTSLTLATPVVATNVGNFPEIVQDGIYGKIVPPCNSSALAKAICDLIDNQDDLERMVNNIKEKWIPSMSWDSIVDDNLKVYSK